MTGSSPDRRLAALEIALVAGFRTGARQGEIEDLQRQLTALEDLLVKGLSHRGPDALRGVIEDIRDRARITPPEDAKELVALAARLNVALGAVEQNWDGD